MSATDYLAKAKEEAQIAIEISDEEMYLKYAASAGQLATAYALIALVEQVKRLNERLDTLTEFEGGKALYVALAK